MEDFKTYIRGKKVTIMGLGLLGGALNDALFLAKHGAQLTVTDLKTKEELAPSLLQLAPFQNITYTLGGHDMKDFKDADFIVQPGNVPFDSPFLAEARHNNIPVYVSESLFALHSKATLVGITGTRGKSTTTQMIYDVLKQYARAGTNVFLGGNVQNTSTLALLEVANEGDIVVLELDSWALHGMGDIKKSPHVAVFTTFMRDHMNYYKGDMDFYLNDKAHIFMHQSQTDYLVLGEQVESLVLEKYKNEIVSTVVVARALPEEISVQVPGTHNRQNAACAFETLKILGLVDEDIKKGLEEFKGVPGRLECVGEKKGVKIYNDTTATTPDATIVALKALDTGDKNIVLIAGGADKELDMSEFVREAHERTKMVVLLKGTGTEKIVGNFPDVPVCDSLEVAIEKAFKSAVPGDIVLFSPAFASFGMFKNEYDRGDQFKALVNMR